MVAEITSSDLKNLEDSLLNKSGNVPLHTRFRALFTLKSLKTEEAAQIIVEGWQILNLISYFDLTLFTGFKDSSALLKHELAYCLGQMKLPSVLPALEGMLRDESQDPMVRHEVSRLSTNQGTEDDHGLINIGRRSYGSYFYIFLCSYPPGVSIRPRKDRKRDL